ncbi:MAG: hypothetical protein J5891_06985 [Spirochaetales bacterium]|nr:hypothetical protein [Spirochaetales bacterium]
MKVECVHLFFQSIYVGNQLFFSVPVADIAVKGKTLPRRVPLDRQLITRGNVREIHIGGNFFAVKTTSAFVVYSASGKRLDIIELNAL